MGMAEFEKQQQLYECPCINIKYTDLECFFTVDVNYIYIYVEMCQLEHTCPCLLWNVVSLRASRSELL